ncbi:MAG TPA: sigma-70 family RNA polymerase sigma factor, partial [Candidatus Eisenbacteria bacterium]|nr:sigma-70 family RNA polymerase sigma factor [Candidatus Eisenbacteria bacterium]
RGELTVWLFGIARNVITDHIRARRRWRWLPVDWLHQLESPDPNPERTVVAEEEHRHLAAALAHLPDRDRDVLGLKFASGLTNREIARITKLTESNVGVIVYRAVARLREQLAGTGGRHG